MEYLDACWLVIRMPLPRPPEPPATTTAWRANATWSKRDCRHAATWRELQMNARPAYVVDGAR